MIEQLKNTNLTSKTIVIIGPPASGKSFLAEQLRKELPDHRFIDTDLYSEYGFEQSLYVLLDDIVNHKYKSKQPLLIVGMLGYRLLRKGVEKNNFYPDIVIETIMDEDTIGDIYIKEREPGKLKGAMTMIKSCKTILDKYECMDNPNPPEWIKIYNDYEPE